MISVMRDSKKERTYDFLWVRFLVCFDFHLHIKAAVTAIWVRKNTLTNRGVNESKVRATVVIGAVVTGVVSGIRINLSRKVNLRISSNILTVSIHPRSAYMACVVVVH